MKTILNKLGPWIFGACVTFGLGVVWGKTDAAPRKEAPELPPTIVIRQPDVEPSVLYLGRADSPGRWYNLPPGYTIVSTSTNDQERLAE